MSATGRNLVGNERRADDFYSTPEWCTRSILRHLREPELALDPCAGVGAILDVAFGGWNCSNGTHTEGIEIDPIRAAEASVICYDALSCSWVVGEIRPDLIITNPPYKLALEFISKALAEVAPGGEVAMLLRLNFLGSQKRAGFLRANPPDVYVLPCRPSFTGKGTDATEYAWMVWGRGRGGRWWILDIPSVPL